ncbi:MAG: hypothetical protein AAGF91_10790 [Actinomycetota bacterium]
MAEDPTLRSAELRGVIIDASDLAHDLRGLLAVTTPPETRDGPRRFGPREWVRRWENSSNRPSAELVRRISNTAEALGRSCREVARLSGHVDLDVHGELLIADADAVWADEKHPSELNRSLGAVTAILQRMHVDVARGRL